MATSGHRRKLDIWMPFPRNRTEPEEPNGISHFHTRHTTTRFLPTFCGRPPVFLCTNTSQASQLVIPKGKRGQKEEGGRKGRKVRLKMMPSFPSEAGEE
ncbi:hypothetical protein CEXT_334081 [Caerostris extrusa]|uniref:Uncharacterized protein n=1 Tax=Caerostris extrusa TaxID=172846 RepID=A0AAV4XWA1_CAEEX|nr:hypothetical protein CEXT_334081 [Caerostris extrusa]